MTTLSNDGHSAQCNGAPITAAGVTSLVALQQTGIPFTADWNGTVYGSPNIINGVPNTNDFSWGVIFDAGGFPLQGDGDGTNLEFDQVCYETLPNKQRMLYAYFGDAESTQFLTMSGPTTAKVGDTVQYTVPFAPVNTFVNDLSVDTTSGQRVVGVFGAGSDNSDTASVSIKFTEAGTYNMKAHCPSGSSDTCLRSGRIVTVVS